jgi:hypothetical protein
MFGEINKYFSCLSFYLGSKSHAHGLGGASVQKSNFKIARQSSWRARSGGGKFGQKFGGISGGAVPPPIGTLRPGIQKFSFGFFS